jgi:hypothetical protein
MLDGREASEMRAHVESCANCRTVFDGYRKVDDVLDRWSPEAEPSPWFDARVRTAVASRQPARAARGFFGLDLNRWLALPVLASLLVVAGVVTFRRPSRVPIHPVVVPAASTVAVPAARAVSTAPAAPQSAAQELKMYQDLSVLEDYDMLAGFDVISELPQRNKKVAD